VDLNGSGLQNTAPRRHPFFSHPSLPRSTVTTLETTTSPERNMIAR
jgi:hypothetical protein